jgi:formate dehydrogenase subunit gamma
VAISFVVLAVSGLVMAFGKFLLLPVIGATLFGWLTYALKTLHNFAGPLFAVALVIFAIIYVRDNIPRAHDLKWMMKVQGMITGHEEPSGKFNAGEKFVFWGGVIVLGLIVVASGLVLDKLLPGMAYLRGDMQIAHIVHAVASLLMMTLFLVHIYMGTVGLDGAYQAMKTGIVDEAWAQEHHGLWYDDIKAGRIPAQRSKPAAPGLGAASPQA